MALASVNSELLYRALQSLLQVFSNTVFGKALGNLVAFLFNSIIKIIFANEDIKAYDAETSAKLIIRTVTAMEKLFEVCTLRN